MDDKRKLDHINGLIAQTEKNIKVSTDRLVESLMRGEPSCYDNHLSIKTSFMMKYLKSLLYTIENKDNDATLSDVIKKWYIDTFLSGTNRPFGLEDHTYLILLKAKEDLQSDLKFLII